MTSRLMFLIVASLAVVALLVTQQSSRPVEGEVPQTTPRVVPTGEPQLCAGSDAVACAKQLDESVQRRVATKGGNDVLAPPLVELMSAEKAAETTDRAINGPTSPLLPKASRDLIDGRLMRIDNAGRVQVFAESSKSLDEAASTLRRTGASIEREEEAYNIVQAWVPIGELSALSSSGMLEEVRLPDYGFVASGSVNSQADALLGVANARAAYGVNGSGVRVGVISDGVQGIASSQGSGDLPAVNTTTCNEVAQSPSSAGAGAEGTAMLEIVHDLAPGAELWFGHFGWGFTGTLFDFLDAVNCLALNTDVVVDDVYFLNQGPYNGGSAVSVNAAYALNTAANRIKGYFNAVGNSALEHYEGAYYDSINVFPPLSGIHVFRPVPFITSDQFNNGPDIGNGAFLPNGESMCLFLQWNDAWGGSINDYDLELWSYELFNNGNPNFVVATSYGNQNGTQNPIEQLCYTNTMASGFFGAVIIEFANEQDRTFDMFLRCSLCAPLPDGLFGQPYFNYNTWCSSVPNNSDATAGVVAAGAIDAADPGINDREPYSSCGPTNDGRMKPELTALDGVNVTANGGFFTPFYGTSAAAPHVAAIAALVLDCTPGLTDEQLRNRLFNHADDLGPPGDDNNSGNGRIDVAGALSKGNCLPTPTPTVTNTPTVTLTPTITPTATPKNLVGDTDGDTVTNDIDDNDDNDGCSDVQETGNVASSGGQRDPHNFWDFFDVPTGVSLVRDGAVASTDIFGVIGRFNSSGDSGIDPLSAPGATPEYHTAFDRGPVVGANPWNVGAANGSVAATDIFSVIGQFNHSCQS